MSANGSVIVVPSPFLTVDYGSNLTFSCTAAKGHSNRFAWIRSDDFSAIDTAAYMNPNNTFVPVDVDKLIMKYSDHIIMNGSTLTIDSADELLNGTSFTCLVINDAGFGMEKTTLYVKLPVVTASPFIVLASDGEEVVLSCSANSLLSTNYTWEFQNKSTGVFEANIGSDSSLVFNSISYKDYGTYRCTVTASGINQTLVSNTVTIASKSKKILMVIINYYCIIVYSYHR